MKLVPGSCTDQQEPTHQPLLKGFSVMWVSGEKCWLLRVHAAVTAVRWRAAGPAHLLWVQSHAPSKAFSS